MLYDQAAYWDFHLGFPWGRFSIYQAESCAPSPGTSVAPNDFPPPATMSPCLTSLPPVVTNPLLKLGEDNDAQRCRDHRRAAIPRGLATYAAKWNATNGGSTLYRNWAV